MSRSRTFPNAGLKCLRMMLRRPSDYAQRSAMGGKLSTSTLKKSAAAIAPRELSGTSPRAADGMTVAER
jgi:hypothetical protein